MVNMGKRMNKEKNKKTEEENYNHIVCIDPGHGGNDNGANNKNRFEKDDNLKLALSIKEELEKDKIKVILTRKDDTYVSLEDRTNIANDSKSELFISIHRNSSDINTAKGIEIWIMDNREDALSLANNIIGELQIIDKDNIRGIKSGTEKGNNINYYVNKYTNMPSCIIELGFISNKEDNNSFDKKMNLYVKHIAMGIFKELN